jgi:hypothetical protein
VTFTATVTSTVGTPGGSVQFVVDGVNQGAPVPLNGSGQATLTLALGGGAHTVGANYLGGANFASSSPSTPFTQTVSASATSTVISSSVDPSSSGQAVTFTATVTSAAGTPGGLVQFAVDSGKQGSPVALNGAGQATLTLSTLASGTHTVTATYLGTANFATSAAALTQTVNPPVIVPPKPGDSTAGMFDQSTATWYLKNSNGAGAPSIAPFQFGGPGWIPLIGDWNGDGTQTIGVFDPNTATWYLRNSNGPGGADIAPFQFGGPGWTPVVGDWNGDGKWTIGVVDPFGHWYLRNSNGPGGPDIPVFAFGAPGWKPIVGDWNGSGKFGIGMFDPTTGNWYLRNEMSGGAPDAGQFAFGGPGWQPVVGDWTGSGKDTIGVVDPNGIWYLRNELSPGAPDVPPFAYGSGSWTAVVGNYSGVANQMAAGGLLKGSQVAALSEDQLQSVFGDALGVLAQDGVSSDVLGQLGTAQVQVTHFGNGLLGQTDAADNLIQIDDTAAGDGWFVDPTPFTNEEFDGSGHALPGSAAAGRMDLLTVVLHELGHLTGHTDLNPALFPDQLMTATLNPSVRRAVVDKVFGGE